MLIIPGGLRKNPNGFQFTIINSTVSTELSSPVVPSNLIIFFFFLIELLYLDDKFGHGLTKKKTHLTFGRP